MIIKKKVNSNFRLDLFGNIPKIGDTIIFMTARSKELAYGECVGFSKAGLPLLEVNEKFTYPGQTNKNDLYSPKTGFVCYYNK
jgi:hypothetical protein